MRFVLGGLVAGLVLNLTGLAVVGVFLPDAVRVLVEAIGGPSPWMGLAHLGMRFAAGFAVLWVLIATRARLGGFARALGISVVVCWTLGYPAVLELWILLGALQGRELLIAILSGPIELTAAAWLGWLAASSPERTAVG